MGSCIGASLQDHRAACRPGNSLAKFGLCLRVESRRGADRCLSRILRAMFCKIRLGARHQVDHTFIGFARCFTKRKYAVLQEHHAYGLRARFARKGLGAILRQVKPGHQVGNHDDAVTVNLPDTRFTVRRIAHGKHRVRMRMVYVIEGQASVQNRLNRGRRRGRPQQMGGHFIDHLRIRQRIKPGEALQMREARRRKTRLLNGFQIPTAALDMKNRLIFTEQIPVKHFYGGIPAAMHYQRLVAPEQA